METNKKRRSKIPSKQNVYILNAQISPCMITSPRPSKSHLCEYIACRRLESVYYQPTLEAEPQSLLFFTAQFADSC